MSEHLLLHGTPKIWSKWWLTLPPPPHPNPPTAHTTHTHTVFSGAENTDASVLDDYRKVSINSVSIVYDDTNLEKAIPETVIEEDEQKEEAS